MNLTMVPTAQRHGEFIADLAPERGPLREVHMVGVRWLPAADQARLFGNETDVIAVADGSGKASMLLSMFWERDLRAGRIGLSRARGFSRAAATGKTLSIQGVGQGPSAEKNPLHIQAEVDAAARQGKRQ